MSHGTHMNASSGSKTLAETDEAMQHLLQQDSNPQLFQKYLLWSAAQKPLSIVVGGGMQTKTEIMKTGLGAMVVKGSTGTRAKARGKVRVREGVRERVRERESARARAQVRMCVCALSSDFFLISFLVCLYVCAYVFVCVCACFYVSLCVRAPPPPSLPLCLYPYWFLSLALSLHMCGSDCARSGISKDFGRSILEYSNPL